MRSLDDLNRSVQSVLSSKRLGTPVFVRWMVHAPVAAGAATSYLAQLCHLASSWLGQELHRSYALGTIKSRHITLTLEHRGGATAQITWVGGTTRGPSVDLMLVGNHGTLYHDAGMANSWQGPLEPSATPAPKDLQTWIERALRSNQPETAK